MKIAILFSGVVRGGLCFSSSYNYLIEKLLSKGYSVDCFFHTWDEQEVYSPGGQSTLSRRFPKSILDKIPQGITTPQEFSIQAPELAKIFEQRYTMPFDKSSINKIHNIKDVSVENQSDTLDDLGERINLQDFRFKGKLNQVLMFYGLFKSYSLMLSSDKKYDYIIKLRPDIKIKSVSDDIAFQVGGNDHCNTINLTHNGKGCGDILFHGIPSAVEPILKLWGVMFQKGKPFYDDNDRPLFAERLLSYILNDNSISYRKSNLISATFPSQLSEHILWLPPQESIVSAVNKDFGNLAPNWCLDLIHLASSEHY